MNLILCNLYKKLCIKLLSIKELYYDARPTKSQELRSLFYLETALHILGGTSTYHQERKQLYQQHLVFVTPLLLPAACRYSGR